MKFVSTSVDVSKIIEIPAKNMIAKVNLTFDSSYQQLAHVHVQFNNQVVLF